MIFHINRYLLALLALAWVGTAWAQEAMPIEVIRIERDGPLTGVAVKAKLNDPRVELVLAMAGDAVVHAGRPAWQLDTVSHAARKHTLTVAMNASFFGVIDKKPWQGKSLNYYVGNAGYPVGWHVWNGVLHASAQSDKLRASLVVPKAGAARIESSLALVTPSAADFQLIISGNAHLLSQGGVLVSEPGARAPRTAVGLSADGQTIYLLALNGRSKTSQGASLAELAKVLQDLGATDAINLDGGGSTALVLQDPATGVHLLATQPSDPSAWGAGLTHERAVVDVIGLRLR
jgi:Phosphodiester glycosidase